MSDQADYEPLVEQFINVTNSTKYLAEQYLGRNNNDLVDAIEDYYATNKATPEAGSTARANQPKKHSSGVRTFRDLNNEEEDSEDDKTNTNFFTGGEKSGLQVEDPNKKGGRRGNDRSIVDQIFQRAKEQMDQPDERPSANTPEVEGPKFSGTGFKLGDGEEPSQVIEDPNSSLPQRPAKVTREITFWKQGFTVGDGPLHRYDDESNASVLQELNRGRVPMSLLDVEFGQDVDVSVFKKTDEDWVPPKRRVGGFVGSGQRLGSPVPGEVTPQPQPAEEKPETAPKPENEVQGDSPVQIRFANGKRASTKFNSSDSILQVYEFVRSHELNDGSRAFTLSHAFPVKPIEDSAEITVAEAKLKNAVIVQRWA
ncbi:SEP-domain-containing protein [Suhomyces tanzawaensis NRRL Y-17324]|uniref:SEP-domain-containing protein n=1 Tax=Suhomyces tanzawaensis NRRL Y-17324 TaxID=984487 RepID=A0A1E4SK94_9ASCO|nr:SEP-domain-containing protein [Suhomyces tanzawaensis NRRL Y-17324]ODV79857.1 SEP-domain-containing protein [Suhomyces tanzawaensis NRRL Y-17324]